MSIITVTSTPTIFDGIESSKMFVSQDIETLDHLAHFFAEVAVGLGFSYVDSLVFINDRGKETSSYDFKGFSPQQ